MYDYDDEDDVGKKIEIPKYRVLHRDLEDHMEESIMQRIIK